MSDVDKIRSAGEKLSDLQDVLTVLQAGLERAEKAAVAVEEAERRVDRLVKLTLGLVGLLILSLLLSRRKLGD